MDRCAIRPRRGAMAWRGVGALRESIRTSFSTYVKLNWVSQYDVAENKLNKFNSSRLLQSQE